MQNPDSPFRITTKEERDRVLLALMFIYGEGAEMARLRGLPRTAEYLRRSSMDFAEVVRNG